MNMMNMILAFTSLSVLPVLLSADGTDCSMCHDTAPVPSTHPAVADVSSSACFACHMPTGDDPLFASIHSMHPGLGLSCDSCHGGTDIEALKASLMELAGKPLP